MRHAILTTSLLFVLSLSAQARGQTADAKPTEAPTEWYGWQTVVSDVLSVSTMVLAADLGSSELGVLGIASFIATPPIIHMAHGQWLAAGLSLTLRAGGTTLLVAGLALALSDFGDDRASDDDGAALTLSILGIMALFAAPLVDATIANEKKEQAPARAWTVQPWLSPQTRAGGLTFSARL